MPERKIAYQSIDNKATPGFVLTAPSLERLYVDAGLAFTDTLVRLDQIDPKLKETLQVEGKDRNQLLIAWIEALSKLFHDKKFLSKRIVFEKFDGKSLRAALHGDLFDPFRHGTTPAPRDRAVKLVETGEKNTPEPHFYAKVQLNG